MYERILVPLDGSDFSEEVIPYAEGLAAVHGTPLVVLRIVDPKADHDEAMQYIEHVAAAHGARGECLVSAGDVADTIVEAAHRVPATLVAITSHGRSGLMEAMLGSVALRLVRSGAVPVLVYRPRGDADDAPVKVRSVVLPLDGSEVSEAVAGQAADFAHWIGAELVVVAAIDAAATAQAGLPAGDVLESNYVRSAAAGLEARHGQRIGWEVLHGEPVAAISGFLAGRRDAVLAMTTHGRSALRSALLGSVTSGCLRKAGVPVLVRAP